MRFKSFKNRDIGVDTLDFQPFPQLEKHTLNNKTLFISQTFKKKALKFEFLYL